MRRSDEEWAVFWCSLLQPVLFGEVDPPDTNRFLKQLAQQELTSRENKADLATQMDEILRQIEAVQNQMRETNSRITQFNRRAGIAMRAQADGFGAGADTTSGRASTGSSRRA